MRLATALAALSAAIFLLAGADPAPRGDHSAAAEAALAGDDPMLVPTGDEPVLVLTGNERGIIRPCGCSKPMNGGIHRRAEALEKLRKEKSVVLLASGGDLVVEGGRQQQIKFETMLLAMSVMGYQVYAVGPGEFLLGADYLKGTKELAGFPFVCANARVGGALLFAAAQKIGEGPWTVTGIVPPMPSIEGVEVVAPEEALREVAASLGKEDRLLVFWNGKDDGAKAVARAIPAEVRARSIVAFGGSSDLPREVAVEQGVRIVAIGSRGRDLALVSPDAPGTVSSVRLEEAIQGTDDVRAILDGYRQAVRSEKLVESVPKRDSPTEFVGDAGCVECHKEICAQLDSSRHEHAMASLEKTGDQWDPECVGCHVVGFNEVGGFVSVDATPKLVNVQCETCHGPGEAHAQTLAPTPNGKLSPGSCIRCHDAENSPHFDFKTYWPKIEHKSPPKPPK